jgi:hypothetical protein
MDGGFTTVWVRDAVLPESCAEAEASELGRAVVDPDGFGGEPAVTRTCPASQTVWEDCMAVKAAALPTGSYYVDVDGEGPAPMVVTTCDNTTEGGGWMLVARRTDGGGPLQVTDLTLSTTGRVLPDDVWSVARGQDEMLVVGDLGPAFVFSMEGMRTASCVPLASSLTAASLAHDEASGCAISGRDYDVLGHAGDPATMTTCQNTGYQFRVKELSGLTCTTDGGVARCCFQPTDSQTLYVR